MSNLLKIDNEYKNWITDISKRFKASQIRAAIKVNSEMLQFYWSVGRDIVQLSRKNGYGSDFYNTVSGDLKDLFPDVKSFSPTNLKYMRYFYELYPTALNRQQLVDDLEMENIFHIPWGHHVQILGKCKGNTDKALFYVRKTIENHQSRAVLLNFLSTDLYEHQGKAISNFSLTLPAEQSDLAQEITKDPYNFDFLTLQERYNEKELKDALIDKVGKFDSSYAGQLGTYVVAVNHQLKTEDDNPTIGLLIFKDLDKVEAQYALESSSQPLGVSSYELSKLIPEEFRGSMPTIEEIESEFR